MCCTDVCNYKTSIGQLAISGRAPWLAALGKGGTRGPPPFQSQGLYSAGSWNQFHQLYQRCSGCEDWFMPSYLTEDWFINLHDSVFITRVFVTIRDIREIICTGHALLLGKSTWGNKLQMCRLLVNCRVSTRVGRNILKEHNWETKPQELPFSMSQML